VALCQDRIVGYIALDAAPTFHREGKHLRVVSLVVNFRERGKGVGKALLEMAEKWAQKQGCWVIEITSSTRREKEGTHAFYIGQGYLKNGEQAYFRKVF
jgi:GNAT superfamily N-acetyltransferase